MHLHFKIFRRKLKDKKNVSTSDDEKTISAQENERKRISRELHDSVVQEMLNIDVELRLLKYQKESSELVQQSQRIEGLMSKLIDDIRHLSVELRPSSLDDLAWKRLLNHILNNLKIIMVCKLYINLTFKIKDMIVK